MMKYVIKLNELYFGEYLGKKVMFSPQFEDATFYTSLSQAAKVMKDNNLPEYCKIKQVTYVEHDIGYIEHAPLVKEDMA